MPDWFYRTLARPILFQLPDRLARALALGLMGRLAKAPGGGRVIDFLGHMQPDPDLAVQCGATRLASPVILGWRLDPERRAGPAFARFGIGGVELHESNILTVIRTAHGLKELKSNTTRTDAVTSDPPVFRRIIHRERGEIILSPDGAEWPLIEWSASPTAGPARRTGVVLQTGHRDEDGCWTIPLHPPAGLIEQVAAWRKALGPDAVVAVSGGVANPADAIALIEAGASLLFVDAGLVFNGPGLVKRCNRALLARVTPEKISTGAPGQTARATMRNHAWFWAAALGAAMLGGGALALILAFTRVLLPYDEHYIGLTATELARLNPKLLAFMAHDRATLAGVMLGLGWLYWVLAREGIKNGNHAAWLAVTASALTGFASFFYFLGFGYFDPLHAFVTAVLFQILLMIMIGQTTSPARQDALDLIEDRTWRLAQWGQLLLIVHAAGLLIAGVVISVIGLTHVFVAEDLAFLCIAPGEVSALGERLFGVVAHDRATLGGMLLACGVASLLPTLWSYERGTRWLRSAFLGLGLPAYTAALGIHYAVGYQDWRHLLPAWLGAALWSGGLALSWRYLGAKHPRSSH